MSTMIIQTEPTPNPNALKFLPNLEVRGNKAPLFYKKDPQNNPEADAPVAYALFKIDGIDYRIYWEEAGQGIPLVCLYRGI